jgi:hypothetical protein
MSYQQKIESALTRDVCGGWDRTFLESILEQIAKGRDLSIKQKQTLGKVLARNTEENQKEHAGWVRAYETNYKKEALILAFYHQHQIYYRPMAADILAGRVPVRSKFLRMYENKYSKKVLAQHNATSKYEVGDYLLPRKKLNIHKNVEFPPNMGWGHQNEVVLHFVKRGGFVVEVCGNIKSAAQGAKRYRLLPIGESVPVIVEERFLKKGRRT